MSYLTYNGKMIQSNHKYVTHFSQINTEPFDHFANINFNTFSGSGFAVSSAIADNLAERKFVFKTASESINWTPGIVGAFTFTLTRVGYVLNSGTAPWLYCIIDGLGSFGYSLAAYASYIANVTLNPGAAINLYISNYIYDDYFPDPPYSTNFSMTNFTIT